MSWLLAACMPGMLMLSTVAMQRLESGLHGEAPGAGQIVARLEQTARAARGMAARQSLDTRAAVTQPVRVDPLLLIDEPGLPTRPNPRFRPSALGNHV